MALLYSGNSKDLNFDILLKKLEKYGDKVITIKVTEIPKRQLKKE